jgi:hypothetical protein
VEAAVSAVTPPGDAGERARAEGIAEEIAFDDSWIDLVSGRGSSAVTEINRAALAKRIAAALQSERTAAASQAVADERVRHDAAVLHLVQRMETPTVRRAVRDLTALGLSPECAKILGKAIYGAAEERDEARAAASQARRETLSVRIL